MLEFSNCESAQPFMSGGQFCVFEVVKRNLSKSRVSRLGSSATVSAAESQALLGAWGTGMRTVRIRD